MAELADVLLAAMGWSNSHLHSFEVGNVCYGIDLDDVDLDEDEIDESTVTVQQALGDERRFRFDYDFGDSWEHEVVVEERGESHPGLKHAVCLDGANACPPEEVGGVIGYAAFLEAIGDPEHDQHQNLLEWVGGPFRPAAFNLAEVNARLQRVG
jgi:Plasmid pRiA4b ORF-3-like protein